MSGTDLQHVAPSRIREAFATNWGLAFVILLFPLTGAQVGCIVESTLPSSTRLTMACGTTEFERGDV